MKRNHLATLVERAISSNAAQLKRQKTFTELRRKEGYVIFYGRKSAAAAVSHLSASFTPKITKSGFIIKTHSEGLLSSQCASHLTTAAPLKRVI
jgi:hypothetical protein